MPERTADLRRLVELVERLRLDAPVVAVVGHASSWCDDLVEVLASRLPGAGVRAYDEVPTGADLSVWLETDPHDEAASTQPGARVDVVFVPVSGVRPPRVVKLSWGDPAELLWDEGNAYLGDLPDLLPLSRDLRAVLRAWVPDHGGPAPRGLVEELREALGPDFTVRD